MRTRWRATHVLAHRDGGHALLRDGEIVWEGDTISYVGRGYEGPVDVELDLGEALVMPGLIDLDALTDIDHLVLDSWAPPARAAGLLWSQEYFDHRRRDVFTPAERATVREYALVQLALHGITTYMPIASEVHSAWAEPYDELVTMAETSRRIGLRGYLGPAYRSGVNVARPDGGRHVAFEEERGRTGLLDTRLLVPHGVFTDRHPSVHGEDRGDLATLAAAGVSVIHCPQTSLRYGQVLHSFGAYRRAGINLCLGTDSFPPDLIRGMDTGVHLAKTADGRADAAPAEHYVEAATLGGARALGRADLGRLERGAQADLVAFRLDDIRDGVRDDPVRTFLLHGTARQATHSVVAGRPVMTDGRIPGTDLANLRRRAQELFERMREGYAERDVHRRGADALFPPTFPPFEETTSR
ncbi:amidohydrolase family protein [Streptomyces sp. ITFR-6]|uniref:amidohydrolase family protein n=1 Tax=Streptomyces sp. ITFR-6 TaxID=3075197 RepID=UPI00288999F9|nr:amidohydrolase family protein [Streptomyces sp. ITFR-6]WNI27948.1 amidohydrolase family protein [Streptomyces sp. ITFR-6]